MTARAYKVEARFGGDGKLAMDAIYNGYALLLQCSALLLRWQAPLPVALVYVGVYTAYNLFHPIRLWTISDIAGSELRATLISLDSLLETTIVAVLAPVLGWVATNVGIPSAFAAVGLGGLLLNHLLLVEGHCLRAKARPAGTLVVPLNAGAISSSAT